MACIAKLKGWCGVAIPGDANPVGWVERSDTHQRRVCATMSFASLYPSYGKHTFAISRR